MKDLILAELTKRLTGKAIDNLVLQHSQAVAELRVSAYKMKSICK